MIRKTTIDQIGSDFDLTEADYRLEALKLVMAAAGHLAHDCNPKTLIDRADTLAEFLINGTTVTKETTT